MPSPCPPDKAGRGAGVCVAVQVTFDLARRSGSAGLTYAMHLGQLHTWAVHAKSSPYLTDELRSLTASRRLVASVVSEPGTGGNTHRATAILSAAALHKDTSNTSYVPDAGAFLVTALGNRGPKPAQRLVIVRADATKAVEKHGQLPYGQARHRQPCLDLYGLISRRSGVCRTLHDRRQQHYDQRHLSSLGCGVEWPCRPRIGYGWQLCQN